MMNPASPLSPARPSRLRWRLARAAMLLSLVNAAVYLFVDDTMLHKLGALLDRSGRRVAEATTDVRLSAAGDQLDKAQKSYEELVACREALQAQVTGVDGQRAAIAARLQQDRAGLQRMSVVLTSAGSAPAPAAAEQDASSLVRAVQADQAELEQCEATLRRLTEDLARLDREVDRARRALQHQSDGLDRQKAEAAGRKAYRDALDRAEAIAPAGR